MGFALQDAQFGLLEALALGLFDAMMMTASGLSSYTQETCAVDEILVIMSGTLERGRIRM